VLSPLLHIRNSSSQAYASAYIPLRRQDESAIKSFKPRFRKLMQRRNDTPRIYKEFDIAVQSSLIHFLRTELCMACANGFEIARPDTLDTPASGLAPP
jgi:hypothetical protein